MAASELQKAVEKLIKTEPGWKAFEPVAPVGGRAGAVSTGRPSSASPTSAPLSPTLEESDAALREYFGARLLTSSDGLFTIELRPIKKIVLTGDGALIFKDPPA